MSIGNFFGSYIQWVLEIKEVDISTASKTNSAPALLEFGLGLSLAI